MDRIFLRLGAFAGGLGVALGAFGAHALRASLTASQLAAYETGVRYQLIHALALVAASLIAGRSPSKFATAAGWCFAGGIVLFSGSLYLLALDGPSAVGIVTPVGGMLLIAGWACLVFTGRR